MDEVWVVSLCLTLLAIVIGLLSLRPKSESESSKKGKEDKAPVLQLYSGGDVGGKHLELSVEEIQRSLERLSKILHDVEYSRKEKLEEKKLSPQLKREAEPQRRGDSEREFKPVSEMREPRRKVPVPQEIQKWDQAEIQEKSVQPGGIENIMEEIEQAVQETVDSELQTRQRQQRGRRPPTDQWSNVNIRSEDSHL
ncbi:uncharacterized protein LOC135357217 [Latimeria chalumnae]|uniref:uncharacterized protein LOC135357217 n=1 Tax=Latimeria chalumnae TaxID=7897 RepID=UPI00313C8A9B